MQPELINVQIVWKKCIVNAWKIINVLGNLINNVSIPVKRESNIELMEFYDWW